MRARLQPASARSAASTSAITGASAMAGASRSFACVARSCTSTSRFSSLAITAMSRATGGAAGAVQRANTALVVSATPGLTSTAGSAGSGSGGDSTSPVPRMICGRGSRQTGTSAPVERAAAKRARCSGARPLALARRRSAAAASADPPPMPAATGSTLSRWNAPNPTAGSSAASAVAALSTRLAAPSPACAAFGPRTVSESSPPRTKLSRSPKSANTTRLSRS